MNLSRLRYHPESQLLLYESQEDLQNEEKTEGGGRPDERPGVTLERRRKDGDARAFP